MAANVDDFRTLTKRFIPELADQLASLVAKSKNNPPVKRFEPVRQDEESDQDSVYKPEEESEEVISSKPAYESEQPMISKTDNSAEEINGNNTQDYADSMHIEEGDNAANINEEIDEESEAEPEDVDGQINIHNLRAVSVTKGLVDPDQERYTYGKKKKVKTVQVNLEELVEKVKDRILRDLRPEIDRGLQQNLNKDYSKSVRFTKMPADRVKKVRIEEKHPQREEIESKKGSIKGWSNKKPEFVEKPKIRQAYPEPGNVNNQGLQKPEQSQAKRDKKDEIIDEDDFLTKIKISSNKKKDSYEDYVAPKKEPDLFESGEPKSLTTKQEIKTRFKLEDKKENIFDKVIEMAAKRKETLKATTPEYEDYRESTTEAELKARTENIGDYNEHARIEDSVIASDKTKNSFKSNDKVPPVTKKAKLGTMIPTREIYKMSSPNYYAKLPKIAERYNFNEPIPFKDMEAENLKPIGNPPANINGRIRL